MPVNEHFPIRNQYRKVTIAVDLDGKLAPYANNETLGTPDPALVDWMRRLSTRAQFVVFSARPVAHTPEVQEWLARHDIPVAHVAMGSKPPADLFIDDKGLNAPLDAAEDWLEWRLAGRDDTKWADGTIAGPLADEHAQCWENPERPELPEHLVNTFRAIVPVSGGIDSTTAWAMAVHAGHRVVPVYVDTGASYSHPEWHTVLALHEIIGGPAPTVVQVGEVPYQRWLHVDRARNAIIVNRLARLLPVGVWGEIWFGNLADWAETPVYGGDKSHHWLLRINHLLTLDGLDWRVVSPLGSMRKDDAVRWLLSRGLDDVVRTTRSCYDIDEPCLACRSCFRREIAMVLAGMTHDVGDRPLDVWSDGFRAQRDDLIERLRRTQTALDWHPLRTRAVAGLFLKESPT